MKHSLDQPGWRTPILCYTLGGLGPICKQVLREGLNKLSYLKGIKYYLLSPDNQ